MLNKNAIKFLDDVFTQSQTKDEIFIVLEKYHQIYYTKTQKQPWINHIFF